MQEGLQPSPVALFNAASSLAQKVLLLCIDFSTKNGNLQKSAWKDGLEDLMFQGGRLEGC